MLGFKSQFGVHWADKLFKVFHALSMQAFCRPLAYELFQRNLGIPCRTAEGMQISVFARLRTSPSVAQNILGIDSMISCFFHALVSRVLFGWVVVFRVLASSQHYVRNQGHHCRSLCNSGSIDCKRSL